MYTYRDLDRFTAYFHDIVLKYSDSLEWPVAFMSESNDMLVFCMAACWKLGIPFIPLSPKLTQEELESHLMALNPSMVFCDSANINRIDMEEVMLLDDNLFLTAFNYDARDFEMPTPKSIKDNKIFGYFFTSGTSDKPKIVPLKRRQILSAAESSAKNFKPDPNHYWLLCLPLNHIGGVAIILRSLIYNTAIYRMNEFHEEMIREFLMANDRFHAASLVPTMLKRLLEDPLFRTHRDFKALLLGGGPITQDLIKKANERGIPIVSSYGMTETCAQYSANMFHQPSGTYTPMTSVGKPFKPNHVQIRDENGKKLGNNQSGLIWVKGPQVFDGYFDKEQNNGRFDRERWFNTGDYGHLNMRKQLFIESRRTDLIVTGGENVNPIEVEQALERLNYIQEAAVVGVQDDEWGQRVVAYVVPLDDAEPKLNELKEHLSYRLSDFKLPKEVHIVDSLPKTSTGKVKKWQLQAS